MALTEAEAKEWAGGIFIAFFIIAWIVAWIQLQLIYLSRFMFWADLILIPVCFIGLLIFVFAGFSDEWEAPIVIGCFACIVILLLSVFTIAHFYNNGYSDQALQREAQLKNDMASYEAVINLFDGKTASDITNQAIEETINSLCQNPTPGFSCEQEKQYFEAYKEIAGWKDSADQVARFMGIINKNNNP